MFNYVVNTKKILCYDIIIKKKRGAISMKWSEVKNLYPNQFVKFEIVEIH